MSIEAKLTMFSRLFAITLIDMPRVPPNERSRVNCAFNMCDPGPVITFRPDVPKVPAAGIANAAVLKK